MRRVQEFKAPHGRVQIVEIAGGACHVGYLRSEPGSKWQHWGLGEGGFDATVERFENCRTFNPDTSDQGYPCCGGCDQLGHDPFCEYWAPHTQAGDGLECGQDNAR